MICRRYFVAGQVQGVFYRASTRERALELDIEGHARNLPDGRVEVLAAGSEEALSALESWLAEGPPQARVDSVQREDVSERPPSGFKIY